MSMYLSNSDVGPTGAEPGEFVDFPPSREELRLQRRLLHLDAPPTAGDPATDDPAPDVPAPAPASGGGARVALAHHA